MLTQNASAQFSHPLTLSDIHSCLLRSSIGNLLQRHPFSVLKSSIGELLHTPKRISTSMTTVLLSIDFNHFCGV